MYVLESIEVLVLRWIWGLMTRDLTHIPQYH